MLLLIFMFESYNDHYLNSGSCSQCTTQEGNQNEIEALIGTGGLLNMYLLSEL